jgi:hypothetical protein
MTTGATCITGIVYPFEETELFVLNMPFFLPGENLSQVTDKLNHFILYRHERGSNS